MFKCDLWVLGVDLMHPLANSANIKNVRCAQLLRSLCVRLSKSIIQSNVVSFGMETHDIFGE